MVLDHTFKLDIPDMSIRVELEVEFGAFSWSDNGPRAFCPTPLSYAIMIEDRAISVHRLLKKPQESITQLDQWVEDRVFNLDPEDLGYDYKTLFEEYEEEQHELAYQDRQAKARL